MLDIHWAWRYGSCAPVKVCFAQGIGALFL